MALKEVVSKRELHANQLGEIQGSVLHMVRPTAVGSEIFFLVTSVAARLSIFSRVEFLKNV